METITADEIAFCVLEEFSKWPSKRKPLNRGGGVKEWVPLAGIVAQGKDGLVCLAAATGMKCLPQNKIAQALGVTLHDWHAEILAIRSFNRFILEECQSLVRNGESEFLRLKNEHERTATHFQPFELKEDMKLHMYCSEAPCGDASMELTMEAQDDATPWEPPVISSATTTAPEILQGRSYFSNLGCVRRKPARPDAPPTLSKSCSDKLALKQSTSLLSSITSLLVSPERMYISCIVLPQSQYSAVACNRSFSSAGRLAPLLDRENPWGDGYSFHLFQVMTTENEFMFSRRQTLEPGETVVPSNLASFSTPNTDGTLISGSLQGRKQFSERGASPMCKARMWKLALEVSTLLETRDIERWLQAETYLQVKESEALESRRKAKTHVRIILGGPAGEAGWARNLGGEGFSLGDSAET